MIADLDQAPKERVEKPVWRVAFFGRLEERKGIKLFVDAVQVSLAPVLAASLQAFCPADARNYVPLFDMKRHFKGLRHGSARIND